jgi:hypothetical protein
MFMKKIDEIIKYRDLTNNLNKRINEELNSRKNIISERAFGRTVKVLDAAAGTAIFNTIKTGGKEADFVAAGIKNGDELAAVLNDVKSFKSLSPELKASMTAALLKTPNVDKDIIKAAAQNITKSDEWWRYKWNEDGTPLLKDELEIILKERGYTDNAIKELADIYETQKGKYVGKFVKVDPTKRNVIVKGKNGSDKDLQTLYNKGKYEADQAQPIPGTGQYMAKNKTARSADLADKAGNITSRSVSQYYQKKGTELLTAGKTRTYKQLIKLKRYVDYKYTRLWRNKSGWSKFGILLASATGLGLMSWVFAGVSSAISECLAVKLSDEDFEKLKDKEASERYIEISEVGVTDFDSLPGGAKFYYDGTLEKGGKKGTWGKNGSNIELKLDGKSYIVECGDASNEVSTSSENPLNLATSEGTSSITLPDGTKLTAKLFIDVPPELDTEDEIKKFQDWLDANKPNWCTGYKDGKLDKGKNGKGYGLLGPRTQTAWQNYQKDYIKFLSDNQEAEEFTSILQNN